MIVKQDVMVTRKTVICDFCGSVMLGESHCNGCQKHMCNKCRNLLDEDPWTGEQLGVFSVRVCKQCYEKLSPFAKLAENIRQEAAKQIDRLKDAWKFECRGEDVGFCSGSDEHADPAV